jgi:hypothetical protein
LRGVPAVDFFFAALVFRPVAFVPLARFVGGGGTALPAGGCASGLFVADFAAFAGSFLEDLGTGREKVRGSEIATGG